MRWTVIGAILLLGACATTKFESPDLSVIGMEMLESDLFTQRFKVSLRVQNPNDQELPIKGVSCKLEIGGEKFATGVSAQQFVVPAFGEAEFDMMVDAHMVGTLFRMVTSGAGGGATPFENLDYRLTGKVSLQSGMIRSIPFEKKGTLTMPDAEHAPTPE